MSKIIQLIEYGEISTHRSNGMKCCRIPEADFREIKEMLDNEKQQHAFGNLLVDDISKFMQYDRIRNTESIKISNCAGVIQTSSGITLEILPKVCLDENDVEKSKQIFLKMLNALPDSPFRTIGHASLATQKANLLEIFIACFLHEISHILHAGLMSGYTETENNQRYFKGRLLFNQHIKYNVARKERFFCTYDIFSINRAENRILKAALKRVSGISKNVDNQRLCRRLSGYFEGVPLCKNIRSDFNACTYDRNIQHYKTALILAELILNAISPQPICGSRPITALLFSMERLFERYVAVKLRELLPEWKLDTQISKLHIIDEHCEKPFKQMRPDIILSRRNKYNVVADTKWKVIECKENITSGDLYQMFAYTEKYLEEADKFAFLIYPYSSKFESAFSPFYFYKNERKSTLWAVPYDLSNDSCPLVNILDEEWRKHEKR